MRTAMAAMVVVGAWLGSAGGADRISPPQVPVAEGFGVTIQTLDGSSLVGTLTESEFRMAAAFGEITVPYRLAGRLRMGKADGALVVEFNNQDRLSGTYLGDGVMVDTAFGRQRIAPAFIREMRVRAPVKGDGWLAYYSFDRDEGGAIRDDSGNGRDGMARGAVFVPDGKRGGAIQVGRRRGFAEVPDDPAWNLADRPFTLALWLKLGAMPYGEQMIVGHNEGGGEQNKWAFEFWQGNVAFHVNTTRSESYRIAAVPWKGTVGQWHHLAVTRDGEVFRIYVDGACVSEATHGLPLPDAKAPLTIGQAEGLFVEGVIDELMIFDRALPEAEIRRMADAE